MTGQGTSKGTAIVSPVISAATLGVSPASRMIVPSSQSSSSAILQPKCHAPDGEKAGLPEVYDFTAEILKLTSEILPAAQEQRDSDPA